MFWSFSPFERSVKLLALIMDALWSKLSNNKRLQAVEMLAADTVPFLVAIFLVLFRTSTSLGLKIITWSAFRERGSKKGVASKPT